MRVKLDVHARACAYADLSSTEVLNDELRRLALQKARELGADHVEFWRAPFGRADRPMDGFLELVRVPAEAPADP